MHKLQDWRVPRVHGHDIARRKWARFRQQVRVLEAQYARGMIAEETLAQAVARMIGHVKHADALTARRQVFAASLFLG